MGDHKGYPSNGRWFGNGGLIPLNGLHSEVCPFLAVGICPLFSFLGTEALEIWHNWLL